MGDGVEGEAVVGVDEAEDEAEGVEGELKRE